MAEITVCIEIDENGQITVGAEPTEDEAMGEDSASSADGSGEIDLADPQSAGSSGESSEEDAEKSYMQPVKSIEQALSVARDLLKNAAQVGGAVSAPPGGAEQQSAANAAFTANRNK